ncbi:hypothetical protein BRC19_01520 [Candidatus Saccharibacteria bacterium QS_5_54_17]|nr:MAG: hypothetical protein BRC19_01520 [Candidatus Saccharibacteria bacterium QS_5_54_17]
MNGARLLSPLAFFPLIVMAAVAGLLVTQPLVLAESGQDSGGGNQQSGQSGDGTQGIICENVPGNDCQEAGDSQGTVARLTDTITDLLTTIIASVSVLALVVAGFMYMLSAGNPDTIQKAKKTIIYALVGIVVAGLARGIVAVVLGSLP